MARGPFGGSAQNLAIDPRNHQTLLVGTRSALLFRSTDGAATWTALAFPRLYHVAIYSLAIDPRRPDVYWVGVAAEAKHRDDPSAGLYESDDAGKTWKPMEGLRGKSVYALAIWPGGSQTLAAGTDEGVWRSLDGGASWARFSPASNDGMQSIVSLAFDPRDRDVLYAGTPHLPWKTADGGRSWRAIHDGMIDDSDVFSIRVDQSSPERVYASACSGIYCSRDGGGEWTKLQGIPGTDRRTHAIAQDAEHPETLYAGTTVGLWKSMDSGATWVKKSTHDINGMVLDPLDGRTLYLATEAGGIVKSTDGGETFHTMNLGFVNRNITSFAEAGGQRPALLASTAYDGEFGGMFRSEDDGGSWALLASHRGLLEENIVSFAVSPADPNRIYAATFDGLLRSVDGGAAWERPMCFLAPEDKPAPRRTGRRRNRRARYIPPPAFPPPESRVYVLRYDARGAALYAGTSAGLFVSRDGGIYWKAVAGKKAAQPVLAVYLAAGTSRAMALLTPRGLRLSAGGGAAWTPASLPGNPETIFDVALDPEKAAVLMAATSGGLMRSGDGGRSWTLCEKGLPVKGWFNAVAFDPARAERVYAAEANRLYESIDGGEAWKRVETEGLEQAWIRAILPGAKGDDDMVLVSRTNGVYTPARERSAVAALQPTSSGSN